MTTFYVPELKEKGAWIECRDGRKGCADWRGYRDLSQVSKVCIHHTVTHPTMNAENDLAVIKQIHMNGNGWGGVGYNFLITSEEVNDYAKVIMVGDIASIRAHTPNTKGTFGIRAGYGNYYIIGISFIGMLHLADPTDAQLRSANLLVNELIYEENNRLPLLKSWDDMRGHKEFDATACPGQWVKHRPLIINPPWSNESESCDDKIAALNKKHTEAINDLLEKHSKEMAEKQNVIDSINTKHAKEIESLVSKHRKEISDMGERLSFATKKWKEYEVKYKNLFEEKSVERPLSEYDSRDLLLALLSKLRGHWSDKFNQQ